MADRFRSRGRPLHLTSAPIERLEDRSVPATLIGLTTTGSLVTFDSSTPGVIQSTVAVTGLGADSLVGIDTRPANGELIGLGASSRVYVIDPVTGAATARGAGPFTPALTGTSFGVDFNPAVDKIRVVSNTGQNLRLNADTGAVAGTDTALFYDPTAYDAAVGGTAPAPQIVAAAYTKNADASTGKTVTTLYGLDANLDVLVTQGGPSDDTTIPGPNTGTLFVVDKLGFDVTNDAAFDIETGTDTAFVVNGSKLFNVNLTTGTGTLVGAVGGTALRGLTIAAPATGAGTLSLPAASLAFGTTGGPLAVTVTRTGGSTGAVTVDYATSDGTAVAGVDYVPVSGTLTFAAGQTTQAIVLSRLAGPSDPVPDRTFTLTLSAPTGGATLGTTAAATVTIPATVGAPSGRYYAVGAGPGGGPQVRVFDQSTRAEVFSFFPFESTFTGGVTVATGDVTGDGVDDIIAGTGLGGAPRVVVFDGATKATIADFFAYESSFRGGVNVATGDANGDGLADLYIGSGVGGGPRVRVLDGDTLTSASQTTLMDFFAYEDTFRGGVNVGAAELTGDGFADVIAGAGFGGGPRIRTFDGKTGAALNDFFAYDPSFRNGVLVAGGDVTGDGRDDLVAGAGPGGGPNVRVFAGPTFAPGLSFFAYAATQTGGVRVATVDLSGDGVDEILTGPGPGSPPQIKFFLGTGEEFTSAQVFDASFTGGVFVG